ncbi:DUF4038 domain-containing protein [Nonomuraea sp. M3C6]|uniref:DUF4038 domain-containing protein n=1 Tax=Nonomuraea marmarensis TaxID=3351344 RepID=A0ABW7AI61_9ACTN
MSRTTPRVLGIVVTLAVFVTSSTVASAHAEPTATESPALSAKPWRPVDIALHAARPYGNPYTDVDVSATFTGPRGQIMTMPGFWDGGATWRVRFAPPTAGRWRYTTAGTDSGLAGKHGTIDVSASGGDLDIYRHGFLKTSENNRYFTYADGTPFFWLGDSEASSLIGQTRLNESNDPRFSSQFTGIVDTRAKQGFTVVAESELFANNPGNMNEGGPTWNNGDAGFLRDLNPGFWQNADKRIGYISSKGMATFLAMGVGVSLSGVDQTAWAAGLRADYERLARYMVARYAAYPVVWMTAQEFDTPGNCAQCWADIARYVHAVDPYHRATSLHNYPIYAGGGIQYRDQPWYDFVTLQEGHNRVDKVADYWLKQYQATPARPVLEGEANFEGMDVFWDNHAIVQNWQSRESAWKARVGGAAGNDYGAAGVWWTCWTAQDPNGNCQSFGSTPWNEGLFLPGAAQMGYLKAFFTALPWWQLVPAPDATSWAPNVPTDTQAPFASATSDRDVVVVYYPHRLDGGGTYTGTVGGVHRGHYTMRWYDPRTGSYGRGTEVVVTSNAGQITLPAQPDAASDWTLLIRKG